MVVSPCFRGLPVQRDVERRVPDQLRRYASGPIVQPDSGDDTQFVSVINSSVSCNRRLNFNSHDEEVAWTNNANWLSAGPWLTSREAYLQWVYQGAAAKFAFFMKQIPAHLKPQIDLDAMRKCISVEDEGGHRIYPQTWRHRPESKEFFKTRAQSERTWQAHITKQSAFLPALGGGMFAFVPISICH